jgi:hypothetical protein
MEEETPNRPPKLHCNQVHFNSSHKGMGLKFVLGSNLNYHTSQMVHTISILSNFNGQSK